MTTKQGPREQISIFKTNMPDSISRLAIHHDKEVRIFRGEHGELDEGLAGLLASLRAGHTDPDSVEHVYTQWVEEQGWQIVAVVRETAGEAGRYRTLIRIDEMSRRGEVFYVTIPGWSPETRVILFGDDVPEMVKLAFLNGQKRFHASVNLAAEEQDQLGIREWEID